MTCLEKKNFKRQKTHLHKTHGVNPPLFRRGQRWKSCLLVASPTAKNFSPPVDSGKEGGGKGGEAKNQNTRGKEGRERYSSR